MMRKRFENWLDTFKDNISTYSFYTDFEKVYRNVDDIKIELNILNSLIGSTNIKEDFISLLDRYPEVLKVVPILLAKRENQIKVTKKGETRTFDFKTANRTIEEYVEFMEKTGLFNLLQNKIINNLIDYVTGIEVGMDTNARKNRTGTTMENLVEEYLISKGLEKGKTYFKEMTKSSIEKLFNINLDNISNDGKNEKRFDFVVVRGGIVYGIEVNFYSGGGSKLNETARSYKQLAIESKKIPNFKFIWITDGIGWRSAKGNLEETYDVLEDMANLLDLNEGIFDKYFCEENK